MPKPSLSEEKKFVKEYLAQVQKQLEELESIKNTVQLKLTKDEKSEEDTLEKIDYLLKLEILTKNKQVLKENISYLQNLLNQISIVRHEDNFDNESSSTGSPNFILILVYTTYYS
jgi:hypothetical protein